MDTSKTKAEELLQKINTLGMDPIATLASTMGLEYHLPTVVIQGGNRGLLER